MQKKMKPHIERAGIQRPSLTRDLQMKSHQLGSSLFNISNDTYAQGGLFHCCAKAFPCPAAASQIMGHPLHTHG